jgi:hypothetical protein
MLSSQQNCDQNVEAPVPGSGLHRCDDFLFDRDVALLRRDLRIGNDCLEPSQRFFEHVVTPSNDQNLRAMLQQALRTPKPNPGAATGYQCPFAS